MSSSNSSLNNFHPLIQKWFKERVGEPTEIQRKSWPKIISGEHVLISAPTGSGKTLTAFLWALNQLTAGAWASGDVRTLYISPLRALNNDIQRNLLKPLAELKEIFKNAGETFPTIKVLTRSGDTPQADRRKMLRHPPEILITTPESLNLLLSSISGRSILASLKSVILDEIHAVVDSKRGAHLITAVDRLICLSGEFQRIALSATVRPLETVAEFVGGSKMEGNPLAPRYTKRPVAIIQAMESKQYDLRVILPKEAVDGDFQDNIWDVLVTHFKRIIDRNRSTLLFVNSRALCEKITYKINLSEEKPVAYAHHGSLSREIRTEVERKLKSGELKAIVATNSLELGIDIGHLDEVVMIQTPLSISSAIQRLGRAGHQVGEVSRGVIFPTHSQDFLQAAVISENVLSQDIEAVKPIRAPLDVLAQIIISMTGSETWDIDALYSILKTSYPFQNLRRNQFELVLNMLAGRYADSRIRELKPRISIDRLDNTVSARKGALLALYMSGGTIPDRGYYHLRHHETAARIGQLDEEFVWEARIGQVFTLGTQNWRIERITHNDVYVTPASRRLIDMPFWKSEESSRDFYYSQKIAAFLEEADSRIEDSGYVDFLRTEHFMDEVSAGQLIEFLNRQKDSARGGLPHRHHVVLEYIESGPGSSPGNQLVIHNIWGGQLNRPFAMALDAAWENKYGQRLEMFPGDDCIALLLPIKAAPEEVLSLVTSANYENLLRKRLEGSGYFAARFRECAGRALLITRNKISERMPLWMSRLRSQKLLDAVSKHNDFPILLEAWRTCLQDEFDLEGLREKLHELETGVIKWTAVNTHRPSPFAQGISWIQINRYMYMEDEAPAGKESQLNGDLLKDILFFDDLRPSVSRETVAVFEQKRQRLFPGYAPQSSRELVDWVKERLLVPEPEWRSLLDSIDELTNGEANTLLREVNDKLVEITSPSLIHPLFCSRELIPSINSSIFSGDTDKQFRALSGLQPHDLSAPPEAEERFAALLGEWLQYYGPVTFEFIRSSLDVPTEALRQSLEDLAESKAIVIGELINDENIKTICDSENLEMLLRLERAASRPTFETLDIDRLPLFFARFHGLANQKAGVDELYKSLEQLVCLPAPAELWESEIFPARLSNYEPGWLDMIMQDEDLAWIGKGERRSMFCFESDRELFAETVETARSAGQSETEKLEKIESGINRLFPDAFGRYSFSTLMRQNKIGSGELSELLWKAAWNGEVTNDTFSALRRAIENRFKIPEVQEPQPLKQRRTRRSGSRSAYRSWARSLPAVGNWFLLPSLETKRDLIEVLEQQKDRVRILMDRYGILFRELLLKELSEFQWGAVFKSLRLMELSGEVLSGYFFKGISGPQFISHEAFRILQSKLPVDSIYWINATDPLSLCGLGMEGLKGSLPKRVSGAHLVYRGKDLALVSERHGKELKINASVDDPRLQEYYCSLRHLLTRPAQPLKQIAVELINGNDATASPFLDSLKVSFDVLTEFKKVTLYRRIS